MIQSENLRPTSLFGGSLHQWIKQQKNSYVIARLVMKTCFKFFTASIQHYSASLVCRKSRLNKNGTKQSIYVTISRRSPRSFAIDAVRPSTKINLLPRITEGPTSRKKGIASAQTEGFCKVRCDAEIPPALKVGTRSPTEKPFKPRPTDLALSAYRTPPSAREKKDLKYISTSPDC